MLWRIEEQDLEVARQEDKYLRQGDAADSLCEEKTKVYDAVKDGREIEV